MKVYDLLEDCELKTIEQASEAYEEAYEDEDVEDLLMDSQILCLEKV